ncbi:uncharacterized protein HRG_07268 [Hirsutella rhossiliensis]|uniref:Uncharacterized protein n=1 Tax=Hirsutella rhossiliensis TaxID=111463 RepID=A0A9P8SH59_9HYPO|nr:uncharacterized protein HRG_07268 [Hirsutella rhossiliensis]KAH0961190.1 hypothetical protein HRG_07268 [Hirsutella rhossiliensis]
MPADSGIDHVGCNETAAASTTCTCGSLFAVTDRKIRDLCYNEHCEIRNQLADISSRLGALEAQLANTKPVCQSATAPRIANGMPNRIRSSSETSHLMGPQSRRWMTNHARVAEAVEGIGRLAQRGERSRENSEQSQALTGLARNNQGVPAMSIR